MRKSVIFSFVCALCAMAVFACSRQQAVQAGSEQANTGTYQPRPAPPPKGEVQPNQEMSGELQRITMAAKTFSIRVDNGMQQTFKFDENTMVMGLERDPLKRGIASMRNLIGKEGSEVTVQWREVNGAKIANHIDVIQISRTHAGRGRTKQ